MDHTRDNPLKRFAAFWIAALLITSFAIACVILRPMTHAKVDTAYEAVGENRLATKAAVQSAQSEALNADSLNKAIAAQSKSLADAPSPGSMPLVGSAPVEDVPNDESTPAPAE